MNIPNCPRCGRAVNKGEVVQTAQDGEDIKLTLHLLCGCGNSFLQINEYKFFRSYPLYVDAEDI